MRKSFCDMCGKEIDDMLRAYNVQLGAFGNNILKTAGEEYCAKCANGLAGLIMAWRTGKIKLNEYEYVEK